MRREKIPLHPDPALKRQKGNGRKNGLINNSHRWRITSTISIRRRESSEDCVEVEEDLPRWLSRVVVFWLCLPHCLRTWWAESSSHCLKHPTITHVNGKSISYPHRPDDHHQSSDQSTGPCLVTTSIHHRRRRRRQDGWAKSSNKAHHFPSTHTHSSYPFIVPIYPRSWDSGRSRRGTREH